MKVLEKVNESWWWAEVNGEVGYAPANHLSSEKPAIEDMWQDDEYFTSYEALVSGVHTTVHITPILCT